MSTIKTPLLLLLALLMPSIVARILAQEDPTIAQTTGVVADAAVVEPTGTPLPPTSTPSLVTPAAALATGDGWVLGMSVFILDSSVTVSVPNQATCGGNRTVVSCAGTAPTLPTAPQGILVTAAPSSEGLLGNPWARTMNSCACKAFNPSTSKVLVTVFCYAFCITP